MSTAIILGKQEVVTEITALHERIAAQVRATLQDAVRVGQLLTQQKDALPHGQFTSWVKENLPFTDRTARNYMKLYEKRGELKTETVSVLTDAYRLLRSSAAPECANGDLCRAREYAAEMEQLCHDCEAWRQQAAVRLEGARTVEEYSAIAKEATAWVNRVAARKIVCEQEAGRIISAMEAQ